MSALKNFVLVHAAFCDKNDNFFLSCTCKREEAAAQLEQLMAIKEAARKVDYRCQNDWLVDRLEDDEVYEVMLTGKIIKALAAALEKK